MNSQIILVVEDDSAIREGIRILLGGEGYIIKEAASGEEALSKIDESVDLVILDIMLPGISGIKVCEELRRSYNVPILFLTAKSMESDKTIGFMAGADDYLTKPFSYAELMSRVKALLRRYYVYRGKDQDVILDNENSNVVDRETGKVKDKDKGTDVQINNDCDRDAYNYHDKDKVKGPNNNDDRVIISGRLTLALDRNEVRKDDKPVDLTETEYRILSLLIQNPGKVFSSQNIYETIWEEQFSYSDNSTVMVHISKLRSKIEDDPRNPMYIRNVWGKGYRYEAERNRL